jgi:hypothetical protein
LKYAENTFQKCFFDAYVPKARDTACCSEQNAVSLSEKYRFSLVGIFLLIISCFENLYLQNRVDDPNAEKWNMS